MFYSILNRCIKVATILILSIITVMVSVEVVLRYVFGESLYVTEELTRYALVWMVFLGSSYAIRDNSHFRMEILLERLRGRTLAWVSLCANLLLGAFLFFLAVEGVVALPFQFEQTVPTLNVSMFWFYLAVPVGAGLMLLNLLPKIWKDVLALAGQRAAQPGQLQRQEGETS